MSMLTPPGMGGKKFRVTGDRYPRMRRPRRRARTALVALAALAALGTLGYGTLQLVDVFSGEDSDGSGPQARTAARDCAATPAREETAAPPEPAAVTVNVYNATEREGLAADTADALAERGFTVGEIANAPDDLRGRVDGTGLLLAAPAAEESGALRVLATQVEGTGTGAPLPDEAAAGADPATTVDLVLGEGFTALTDRAEADRRLAELTAPAPADATAAAAGPC